MTSDTTIIYSGKGTIAIVGSVRGIVTGRTYSANPVAFILDDRYNLTAMYAVDLGQRTDEHGVLDGKGRWVQAFVSTLRQITRDEFDRLTGLDTARREMGWAK